MQKFETLGQPLVGFWITVPLKKKSVVIFPEERGYMEEERGFMEEERGYIPVRARLYCVVKIVATFVSACSQGQRMHSARTKICWLICLGGEKGWIFFWWTFSPFQAIISTFCCF